MSKADEVRSLIEAARVKYDDDPESGHSAEDGLAMYALKLCVEGHEEAPAVASLVLELMNDESLTRWYA